MCQRCCGQELDYPARLALHFSQCPESLPCTRLVPGSFCAVLALMQAGNGTDTRACTPPTSFHLPSRRAQLVPGLWKIVNGISYQPFSRPFPKVLELRAAQGMAAGRGLDSTFEIPGGLLSGRALETVWQLYPIPVFSPTCVCL